MHCACFLIGTIKAWPMTFAAAVVGPRNNKANSMLCREQQLYVFSVHCAQGLARGAHAAATTATHELSQQPQPILQCKGSCMCPQWPANARMRQKVKWSDNCCVFDQQRYHFMFHPFWEHQWNIVLIFPLISCEQNQILQSLY